SLSPATGELVPDQVARALEQVALRLGHAQAGDPLQADEGLVLGRLQLLLQLLDVDLAVVQPLLAPVDLGSLPLELVLRRRHLLLDPGSPRPAPPHPRSGPRPGSPPPPAPGRARASRCAASAARSRPLRRSQVP